MTRNVVFQQTDLEADKSFSLSPLAPFLSPSLYLPPSLYLHQNQAYKLELPEELNGIHNTFHVCYLRKFTGDVPDIIPISELRMDENKRMIEEPEAIVDRKTKKLRRKMVDLVLVR